jgi:hypothetical protein
VLEEPREDEVGEIHAAMVSRGQWMGKTRQRK